MRSHDDELDKLETNRPAADPWGKTFVVERELAGVPLDRFLSGLFPDFDRNYLRRLVRDGHVRVDGVPMVAPQKLWRNAVVTIDAGVENDAEYHKEPPPPPVEIRYEDPAVAIVYKPENVILDQRNVDNQCPSMRAPKGDLLRIVGKLEKDASGLVVVTKNLAAHREIESIYRNGGALSEYLAICEGTAQDEEFTINDPIGADERHTGRREVNGDGARPAETRVLLKSQFERFALLVAIPKTHETHQVRVHLQYVDLPVAGDTLYGRNTEIWMADLKRGYSRKQGMREKPVFARIALHVQKIQFKSPASGNADAIAEAAPPADFERFIKSLERYRSPGRRSDRGGDDGSLDN
ncbi:MAG: RluA family pseudouridine synthase [Planctomycetes bacterium]|nr:RluA family pseudouridine synthase [Planctomycetota bacterium]